MNRLGTVIHNVMKTILKPYKGLADFTDTKVLRNNLQGIDQLVVQEIGIQYHTAIASVDALNSMQRIMYKIASAYINVYLQYDIEHYKAFRIIELENTEDYTFDFPIIINGKEETVRLFGIIDRIDEVIDHENQVRTRIVDYKTGSDSVEFKNLEKVFASHTENKALVQTLFYTYVFEQVTGRKQLEPHLYVARRMRDEGTLFCKGNTTLEGETLHTVKEDFATFLRATLEEIFNPNIPFKHSPESTVYPSDPYTLFYRNAVEGVEE